MSIEKGNVSDSSVTIRAAVPGGGSVGCSVVGGGSVGLFSPPQADATTARLIARNLFIVLLLWEQHAHGIQGEPAQPWPRSDPLRAAGALRGSRPPVKRRSSACHARGWNCSSIKAQHHERRDRTPNL